MKTSRVWGGTALEWTPFWALATDGERALRLILPGTIWDSESISSQHSIISSSLGCCTVSGHECDNLVAQLR